MTKVYTIAKTKLNQVHAKLDWLLRRNEKMFQEAVRRWFAFTAKQIQTDLKTKFQKDIASELTDWEYLQERGQEILKPATLKVMQAGGNEAYKLLQVQGAFDVLNTEAVKAAEKFTAELVREVNQGTKEGIRTYISAGVKEGKSMDKIARELRPLAGLTKNQTQSVMNYKALLSDKEKFPKLSASDIDKKATRYADKTHRRRMQTIARTETARAQNIGYAVGMEDLGIEQLELSSYPGCCDECDALDGEKYKTSEAKDVIPVHPNCRCSMLPVIVGEVVTDTRAVEAMMPSHVGSLLDQLEKAADPKEKKRLRRALRKLGHRGGLKRGPVIPTKKPAIEELFAAANIGKAEANARRILNLPLSARKNMSFKGIDVESANHINKGLYNFKQKFPKFTIEGISTDAPVSVIMDSHLNYSNLTARIRINKRVFTNYKTASRELQSYGKSNWLVGGTIEDTVAHECGHVMMFRHLVKTVGGMARQEVKRLEGVRFAKKSLSTYGTRDGIEGLAETIAKYVKTGSIKGIELEKTGVSGVKRVLKTYAGLEL